MEHGVAVYLAADVEALVKKCKACIEEVVSAGVEFDDERVHWKAVQVDRGWFDEAQRLLAALGVKG
jgi:aspartate oxidase